MSYRVKGENDDAEYNTAVAYVGSSEHTRADRIVEEDKHTQQLAVAGFAPAGEHRRP